MAMYGEFDPDMYYTGEPELSPHEMELERIRQEKLLEAQIRYYGEDAMRIDAALAVDNATIPTEEIQRSFAMRIPGTKISKKPEKDPLASLMKAMKISPGKPHVSQKNDSIKKDGEEPSSKGRSGPAPKQTESFSRYTA